MKYQYEIVPKDDYLPIRYFYSNDRKKSHVAPHWHDFIELIYLLSGSLRVVINGISLNLTPDTMVIICSDHIHSTYSEDPATTAHVLQISAQFLQHNCKNFSHLSVDTCITNSTHPDAMEELRSILSAFRTFENIREEYANLKRNALLYDTTYVFSRYLCAEQPNDSTMPRPDIYKRLAAIINYLNLHYQEELPLDDTARKIGLSPAYLSRFFKKYIGITYSEYLDMIRLDAAYGAVTTSKEAILSISDSCGFANYTMFVKKFRRAYGQTPLKARQQYQKKER